MTSPKLVHVLQGEQVVSDDPGVVLTTVLGSCVATCLFDPELKIGGMNHFLLPESTETADVRHAPVAMERLINALLRKASHRGRLRAKLFGGARMIPGLPDIGLRNGRAALAFLENEGILFEASDLGGIRARRIRFWPSIGKVEVQKVERSDCVVRGERPLPLQSSVELF